MPLTAHCEQLKPQKMHIRYILIPLVIPAMLVSCSKSLKQRDLDFGVITENAARQPATSFHAGDTVEFIFSGNPDQLTFFSGEKGRKYQNMGRTSDTTSNIDLLKFSNALTKAGNGTLQLLVSTSFSGYTQINSKDSASVLASYSSSDWTDISSRVTWATSTTAKVNSVSLSDYASAGRPIYLAFRYTAAAAAAQSAWSLTAIGLRHYTADTAYSIDSTAYLIPATYPAWSASPGWGVVSVANPSVKFSLNAYSGATANATSEASSTSTNTITVTGNTNAAAAVSTESWLISGPVNLYQVLPDAGVSVKDMTTNASNGLYSNLSSWAGYAYIFTRPGTYNVTFLASTDTDDAQSSVAKTLTITVQ